MTTSVAATAAEGIRSELEARFQLRERAFEALREAKVEMPFETLALSVRDS
jgi:hypothetical protein